MQYSGTIIVLGSDRLRGLLFMAMFCLAFVLAGAVEMQAAAQPSHLNAYKNPEGCAGCHAGRGVPGSGLLKATREVMCFRCHGSFSRDGTAISTAADIESVLTKFSRHPIMETSFYHVRGETLPEEQSFTPRHVACADCHKAHSSTSDIPWRGAPGYIPGLDRSGQPGLPPTGVRLKHATAEYEVCYLCHSESANISEGQNIASLFATSNASYHPVEAPGRGGRVPSLVRQLGISSRITCTNCHGNNDPLGPKGPHASDYEPILIANYRTEDGPEEPTRYELCYVCHDRRSILGDESFIRHNFHIVAQETSCYTCHASHGSIDNRYLIEFNIQVVEPSPSSGGPLYIPGTAGNPQCFLQCHGVDHNNVDVGGNPWP